MNLKRILYALIILIIFFVGCSNYQVENKSMSLPDEATKQKNMTKIQNNINEIIGKDYNYIIKNLGEPDVASYVIDKENLSYMDTMDDMQQLMDISLTYLKNVSDEDVNSSALYLQLKDKIVKKAQIVDSSATIMSKKSDQSKVLVDYYNDKDVVEIENLNVNKFNELIGIDYSEVHRIVGDKQPFYDAHSYNKVEESIKVYHLDDNSRLLCIFTEDNKISKIELVDNKKEVVNEIKNIILDN